MKRILVVFGTRPEAIKMAPVIKELQKYSDQFKTLVCVTAQHREMLDSVLELFAIRPEYDLDLMKPGQDLYGLTANILLGIRTVLDDAQPDLVLVHGDTTTTMAASLSAFYARIPVAHVEAGLRTHNKYAPFPEEINRAVTGVLADIHFAPTDGARQNLLREGVADDTIIVTGNTVIDALLHTREKIRAEKLEKDIVRQLTDRYPCLQRVLSCSSSDAACRLILVTGHRRENFGEGFENICRALKDIAEAHADVHIVYPVHLNPNVQEPVKRILSECRSVSLIEPQDYLPFIYLMDRSYLIITDSGGVQEEAPALGRPVLVMRETTERSEGVEAATVRLVGTDREKIVKEVNELLDNRETYKRMASAHNPYGDGNAAQRIREFISLYKRK